MFFINTILYIFDCYSFRLHISRLYTHTYYTILHIIHTYTLYSLFLYTDIFVEPFKLSTTEANLVAQNVYTDFITNYIQHNNIRSSLGRYIYMYALTYTVYILFFILCFVLFIYTCALVYYGMYTTVCILYSIMYTSGMYPITAFNHIYLHNILIYILYYIYLIYHIPYIEDVVKRETEVRMNDPRCSDIRVKQSIISKFFVLPHSYTYDDLNKFHVKGQNSDSLKNGHNSDRNTLITQLSSSSASYMNKGSNMFKGTTTISTTTNDNNNINYNDILSQSSPSTSTSSSSTSSLISTQKGHNFDDPWETELLTLSKLKQINHLNNDKIYNDFKIYINNKYKNNEINLDIGITDKLATLERDFRQQGQYTYMCIYSECYTIFIAIYLSML